MQFHSLEAICMHSSFLYVCSSLLGCKTNMSPQPIKKQGNQTYVKGEGNGKTHGCHM